MHNFFLNLLPNMSLAKFHGMIPNYLIPYQSSIIHLPVKPFNTKIHHVSALKNVCRRSLFVTALQWFFHSSYKWSFKYLFNCCILWISADYLSLFEIHILKPYFTADKPPSPSVCVQKPWLHQLSLIELDLLSLVKTKVACTTERRYFVAIWCISFTKWKSLWCDYRWWWRVSD